MHRSTPIFRRLAHSSVAALPLFLVPLLATFAASPAAAEETVLVQCSRSIAGGNDLEPCETTSVLAGPLSSTLNVRAPIRHGEASTCYFKFWSYAGEFFPPESLPTTIEVEDGMEREAAAWYYCSGPGGICPPEGCSQTRLHAIDLSANARIHDPFIEMVDPTTSAGDCLTDAPCATTNGAAVESVVAKRSVSGLRFVAWLGESSGETALAAPSGLQIALYRRPDGDGCSAGRTVAEMLDRPVTCIRPRLDEDWIDLRDLRDRVPLIDVDRICQLVLDCPGCGPRGLCPGWRYVFEGEPLVDILLHDAKTGEILAKARQEDGARILAFTPEFGAEIEAGRYLLSFSWGGKEPPKGPVELRVDLQTVCSE